MINSESRVYYGRSLCASRVGLLVMWLAFIGKVAELDLNAMGIPGIHTLVPILLMINAVQMAIVVPHSPTIIQGQDLSGDLRCTGK